MNNRRSKQRDRTELTKNPKKKSEVSAKISESRRQSLKGNRYRLLTLMSCKWIWGVITIGATLSAYFLYKPDISVEPYMSLNPMLPFETHFQILNESVFSIHDVHYDCEIREIHKPGAYFVAVIERRGTDNAQELSPKQKYSIYCGTRFTTPMTAEDKQLSLSDEEQMSLDNATLNISVYFRPSFYPNEIRRSFRFDLRRDKDQVSQWMPVGEAAYFVHPDKLLYRQ